MVKVSEASGKMVEMLRVLSEYLSFEEETKRRVKGALTYPMIMAIMAIVAVGVMMFFVLPKFVKIYEAKEAALPKITQMLLSLSAVMTDGPKMMGLVTVLLLTSVAIHYWLGTVSGRRVIDFVKIRMPVLGTMFVTLMVTRSMRIMATMINTGVNLLEAIEVIRGSCNNYYFQRLWSATDRSIRDGYQLSDSIEIATQRGHADVSGARELRNRTLNALIDPGTVHMLRAGERSGQLGQVSDKISVFYGKKLEASVKSVTALVEPLMIVVIGAIIGTVAIAMLLPVFKISSIIAR
jgi:type IV pilus assembly protein PilC